MLRPETHQMTDRPDVDGWRKSLWGALERFGRGKEMRSVHLLFLPLLLKEPVLKAKQV